MKLYFLRHGSAEDRRVGLRDFDRQLTPEGIAEMKQVAQGLYRLIEEVDVVITSPLPRAAETAGIAETALRVNAGPTIVSEKLAAGAFGLTELQQLVGDYPSDYRVLLVGHEPDFSEVVGELTGANIEMKKAGLALVEVGHVQRAGGVLRWLLTPRHMLLGTKQE